MVHIATVHFGNSNWLEIQLGYFRRYLSLPFHLYVMEKGLSRIERPEIHYLNTEATTDHGHNLNILASYILRKAKPEDWLIFCDGDAFPVAGLGDYITEKLLHFPLLAIQRRERYDDIQPHPAFCVTTAGFWEGINGDWRKGYSWTNNKKQLTDTGGNLLGILQKKDINWYPMLRSNKNNPHKIFFGIYDNVVYHHGAGFREPIEDTDKYDYGIHGRKSGTFARLTDFLLRTRFAIPLKKRIHPALRLEQKVIQQNKVLSDTIFAMIKSNPHFSEYFNSDLTIS